MEAVQMLQRFTQVGEFYVMSPPTNAPDAKTKGAMDVLIYDEESDRHVKITWESALAACCVGAGAGVTDTAVIGKFGEGFKNGPTDTLFKEAKAASGVGPKQDALNAANSLTLAKWKAEADEWSAMNKEWDEAVAKTLKPVCIVLARPFIEHAMLSAVLTVSGGDTGATIFGPSDMQASYDVSRTLVPCALLRIVAHTCCVVLLTDLGEHVGEDHRGCAPHALH